MVEPQDSNISAMTDQGDSKFDQADQILHLLQKDLDTTQQMFKFELQAIKNPQQRKALEEERFRAWLTKSFEILGSLDTHVKRP